MRLVNIKKTPYQRLFCVRPLKTKCNSDVFFWQCSSSLWLIRTSRSRIPWQSPALLPTRVHVISHTDIHSTQEFSVGRGYLQHIRHCRFPGISNTLLIRCRNQAHIETCTAPHWWDIDNLPPLPLRWLRIKPAKRCSSVWIPRSGITSLFGTQKRKSNTVISSPWGVFIVLATRTAGAFHNGMVYGKAIQ